MEMALRSKAQFGALLILALGTHLAAADPLTFQVHHQHLRHGADGTLRVSDDGIAFEEGGKDADHSRQWRFEDIQQLTLSPETLRIKTYEDRRWDFGRDREFVFDRLPKDLAAQLYPIFSRRLDQRFVAALADDQVKVSWEVPAKLLLWRGGSQGSIVVGSGSVIFRADLPQQSRTWRITDIDNVSSSGPFDLTITTFERATTSYASHKDFHFALKRPISEADYNALWTKVNQSKGLKILNFYPQQEREQQ
jgi:hypothetical protein